MAYLFFFIAGALFDRYALPKLIEFYHRTFK